MSEQPITREAHSRLELELARLREERVLAIPEEQAIIDARVARIEEILSFAQIVENSTGGNTVAIGSHVTLLDQKSGRTETYVIDGAHGSMDSNVISAVSPMGTALIGSERGAVVDVELPRGRVRTFTVLDAVQPGFA